MHYKFQNPGKIKIRARTSDQEVVIDITGTIWRWRDGGMSFKIDWNSLPLNPTLREISKAYIAYALQNNSPVSVYSNHRRIINVISKSELGKIFPWPAINAVNFLNTQYGKAEFSNFRAFYRWCVKRQVPGFTKDIELSLSEKAGRRIGYDRVLMNEINLSSEDEFKILQEIEAVTAKELSFEKLRNNVLLHLGFELGPRPIQIFSLDEDDLAKYAVENSETYFTLWLPMAKKRSTSLPEKRPRRITSELGIKVEQLISLNRVIRKSDTPALFLTDNGRKRLPTPEIGKIISKQLKKIGFKTEGLMVLRHHLGQSLADQGASAESISEILGHNSTVPARAYISATPDIGTIKAKALGKNGTYLNIMKMMLTGDIINREGTNRERWVKGMVGAQYIGGIGVCGLSTSTPCPKNPVYACYTCNKFHPFRDGTHADVRIALQKQAQFFIDTAGSTNSLDQNRTVGQLETTIHAVDSVIENCKSKAHTDGDR